MKIPSTEYKGNMIMNFDSEQALAVALEEHTTEELVFFFGRRIPTIGRENHGYNACYSCTRRY